MPATAKNTGLSITNPLVLYRALLATKRIEPDPAQHRLALHLQKVYERLKDYEPIVQYGFRLQQISRALDSTPARPLPGSGHEHPLATNTKGVFSSLFEKRGEQGGLALTKVLTNYEAAKTMDSPQGLLLHGEVGTGKSMLIDLFAESLPHRAKRRLHYSTFMLDTLAKLEQLRRSRLLIVPASFGQEDDYSLLWLARDMISTSPILFLDEFQLPDRAAAKIITNLMTCFFRLGGVLIATSNRMPEELARAAGAEFAPVPPVKDTLAWRFMRRAGYASSEENTKHPRQSDFAAFLDVLRARCEVWEMESKNDYRRKGNGMAPEKASDAGSDNSAASFHGLQPMAQGNVGLGFEQNTHAEATGHEADSSTMASLPQKYFIRPPPPSNPSQSQNFLTQLQNTELSALPHQPTSQSTDSIPWVRSSVHIYTRALHVPRTHAGITKWTFQELCQNALGPADYITLASTYHTLILTDVPVLSLLQKNEARRLITLLDALYEAKCKLLVTADAGPDGLFFPESAASGPAMANADRRETVAQDPTLSETFSEIYQDTTAPFRPNVASYTPGSPDPPVAAPEEPDLTHARLASNPPSPPSRTRTSGADNPPDQLEDTPPNTLPHGLGRGDSIYGRDTTASDSRAAGGLRTPDFTASGIFTGEDERFAYRRAASRLWEMCGARWWARQDEYDGEHGASDGMAEAGARPSWWRPIPPEVRRWEYESPTAGPRHTPQAEAQREKMEQAAEGSDKEILSPFRTSAESPPRFSLPHFWGMMRRGARAGRRGQGVEALRDGSDEVGRDGESKARGGHGGDAEEKSGNSGRD